MIDGVHHDWMQTGCECACGWSYKRALLVCKLNAKATLLHGIRTLSPQRPPKRQVSKAKPPYAHRHAVGLRLGKVKCGHNQPLLTRNSQTHENARGHSDKSDKGTRLLRESLKKSADTYPSLAWAGWCRSAQNLTHVAGK